MGLGVFLRVIVYLSDRPFWMDEASLWGNLAGKPILDFSEPLAGDQLAPLGFLIAQRALMSVLGTSRYASRLLPLACGLISLFLFARLARRILPRRPALIALVLFSFSDDLIYYSSELKPYSLDLAIGLAVSLAAVDALGKPAIGAQGGGAGDPGRCRAPGARSRPRSSSRAAERPWSSTAFGRHGRATPRSGA